MSEPSRIEKAIRTCSDALFTGILRVYAKQADGEIWFLSGIVERLRFGVSIGDDATSRLLASTVSRLEVVPCLPNPAGGFKKGQPKQGTLGATRPVDLLRFCETHALTCKVFLESDGSKGSFVYRLGELVSVACDAGTDRAVAKMLEWSEGNYRFELPEVDLPPLATDDAPPSRRPETDYPPPSVGPASVPPPVSLADQAARVAAADEARKRRAEEVEVKHRVEDQRVVPPPADSKSKRRPAERAPNRAQRRAELKRKSAADAAAGRSMVVRVRRVTTEVALVSVPLVGPVTKPDGEGNPRVDPEALFQEAARMAREGEVRWQKEGDARIEPHPDQPPLLESVDLVRRG